jgi:D-lactate dehydrogenase (cytochrome)
MPSNVISTSSLISPAELSEIDSFATAQRGETDRLQALSGFLKNKFNIELNLDPEIIAGFAADSSNLPGAAEALARPVSELQCAILMRTCFQAGLTMTISGGKSNLTGSATPEGGVLISTVNMVQPPVAINSEKATASVPVGMLLEEMRREILSQSKGLLTFPVDPTSRAEASIGGSIACNCSGFTPGETGSFRSWLKSMRLLLPDGNLIEAQRGQYISADGCFLINQAKVPVPVFKRPEIKNAGGPFSAPDGQMDLIDFVVGSEGIYGLVSGCHLKLAKSPDGYLDIFFSLPGEAEALRFLDSLLKHCQGDLSHLGAFEYFGVNCRKYMKHEERFFRGDDQVGVYVQEPLNGKDELDAAEAWLEILAEAELNVDEEAMILLDSNKLRELFMEARHSMPANALEVVQHRGTFTIMTDTVVPPKQFPAFLDFTHQLLSEKGFDYLSFGHLGDCHLHFTVLPEKDQVADCIAAYDAIVARSAELGGVYSGEHGTGKRKRKDFLSCYGQQALDQVKATKLALDPELLLNRGNVFEA